MSIFLWFQYFYFVTVYPLHPRLPSFLMHHLSLENMALCLSDFINSYPPKKNNTPLPMQTPDKEKPWKTPVFRLINLCTDLIFTLNVFGTIKILLICTDFKEKFDFRCHNVPGPNHCVFGENVYNKMLIPILHWTVKCHI